MSETKTISLSNIIVCLHKLNGWSVKLLKRSNQTISRDTSYNGQITARNKLQLCATIGADSLHLIPKDNIRTRLKMGKRHSKSGRKTDWKLLIFMQFVIRFLCVFHSSIFKLDHFLRRLAPEVSRLGHFLRDSSAFYHQNPC